MATLKNSVINDTGFIKLPSGTTEQRPDPAVAGMIRYNTDIDGIEGYDGTEWRDIRSRGSFTFTTATFTTGGATGRFGPTLEQARSGIILPPEEEAGWIEDTELFDVVDGIQIWTVPATGSYQITALGAQGGGPGGAGAIIEGTFELTSGEKIRILVGQSGDGTAGGGGTFVVKDTQGTPTNDDILVIAGGGGGKSNGANASFTTSNASGTVSNGSGGLANNGSWNGPAGGGFFTSGQISTGSPRGTPGNGFIQGGAGGENVQGGGGQAAGEGGFGGGGSGGADGGAGGGCGGGYSGGSGGPDGSAGDGGGSFNNGTSPGPPGFSPGPGEVTITLLD